MQVDIAVFARAPVPGQAKTRLIARLGAEGAAALQHALIRRALRTALAANLGAVSLWCAPDCEHPAFVGCSEQFGVPLSATWSRSRRMQVPRLHPTLPAA